jgi:hypothetical protein
MAWFCSLQEFLDELGYFPCEFDCCRLCGRKEGHLITFSVLVDELVIAADAKTDAIELRNTLSDCFRVSDERLLHYILGREVKKLGNT